MLQHLFGSRTRNLVFPDLETKFPKNGFSIIEILVVTTVLIGVMGALIGFAVFSLGATISYKQTAQATSLAQEGMEAMRNFRDAIAWDNNDSGNEYDGLGIMALATPYYPRKSLDNPPKWQFIQGTETVGIFTRSVSFVNGQRNAQQDLVESGGTSDSDTKKVTVQVSWLEASRQHSVSITSYFTNWK